MKEIQSLSFSLKTNKIFGVLLMMSDLYQNIFIEPNL